MTLKQFFKKPNSKMVFLKKPNGKKHYILWWEQGFDCFVNKVFTSGNIPDQRETSLICRRDFDTFIKWFEKDNYKIVNDK